MGQTLSEPVTEKTSINGKNKHFAFGASGMQGWRITMEDAHSTILSLPKSPLAENEQSVSFFAVFDGHGGEKVAQYCGANMHKLLIEEAEYANENYARALELTFLNTDQEILKNEDFENDSSGCTATVILAAPLLNKICCANAGDSRAVLCSRGHAKPLSYDHKPTNEAEMNRIRSAGGWVEVGRVNGNLALSRAIGDFDFKKNPSMSAENQVVTAFPDVIEHILTADDEFIVLACDGIWDCKTSQTVVEFVRRGIASRQDLDKIAERLMDSCLSTSSDVGGIGCDNMTVVIVALLNGKSVEEWYEMVKDRVENNDGPVADEWAENDAEPQVTSNQEIHKNVQRILLSAPGLTFDQSDSKSGKAFHLEENRIVFADEADAEPENNSDISAAGNSVSDDEIKQNKSTEECESLEKES